MSEVLRRVIHRAVENVRSKERTIGVRQLQIFVDVDNDLIDIQKRDSFHVSVSMSEAIHSGYETVDEFTAWFQGIITKRLKRGPASPMKAIMVNRPAVAPVDQSEGVELDLESKEIDHRKVEGD